MFPRFGRRHHTIDLPQTTKYVESEQILPQFTTLCACVCRYSKYIYIHDKPTLFDLANADR